MFFHHDFSRSFLDVPFHIPVFCNLLRLFLWLSICPIFLNVHCAFVKNVHLIVVKCSFLEESVLSRWLKMFYVFISIWFDCSINYWKSGINIPKYVCAFIYFSFHTCQLLLYEPLYFEPQFLGAYTFFNVFSAEVTYLSFEISLCLVIYFIFIILHYSYYLLDISVCIF